MSIRIRYKTDADREWIEAKLIEEWGSIMIERAGEFFDATTLETIVAERDGEPAGFATLLLTDDETEIMTIKAFVPGQMVGTVMLQDIVDRACQQQHRCVKVFTSNDNLDALRFYQRRGFRIENIWKDSITEARKVKPSIPIEGQYGIPCCDEIELHRAL